MDIPEGVEIKVSGKPSKLKRTRLGAVFGPLLSTKRYVIHNSSLRNVVRGLLERVFFVRGADGKLSPPPNPVRDYFSVLRPEFSALTRGRLLRPVTLPNVVGLWTGRKRKVYEQALDSLRLTPLSRSDARLSTFVKCEKIDASKVDPAPRVIQPRSPRYNIHLACYLKPHEHEFYHRIDQMFDTDGLGDKTVFKGLNARSAAHHLMLKASRYSNPVFVGLDASRFDQHVSVPALKWEHSIYESCFAYGTKWLSELLSWQLINHGLARIPDGSRVRYTCEGRRMSGDMNTSLGNCILMSSLVHAYCREAGIPKPSLANNGDDCVLMFERKHLSKLSRLPTWFREMGFTMKVEPPVFDLRQVSFCQVNLLTSPNYNICVRNPHVVTSKDLHSTYPFTHENEYFQWLTASGICGSTSHQGVPVLEAFYSSFPIGEITNKKVLEELDRWQKYSIVGGAKECEISAEMRHSMWVAFGILPDSQIALEDMYRSIRFGTSRGAVAGVPYVSLLQGNI